MLINISTIPARNVRSKAWSSVRSLVNSAVNKAIRDEGPMKISLIDPNIIYTKTPAKVEFTPTCRKYQNMVKYYIPWYDAFLTTAWTRRFLFTSFHIPRDLIYGTYTEKEIPAVKAVITGDIDDLRFGFGGWKFRVLQPLLQPIYL